MEIFEIFKDSVKYPFSNVKMLLILGVILLIGSICNSIGSFAGNSAVAILGTILSLILSIFILGYCLDVFGFSIDLRDDFPDFNVKRNIVNGLKLVLVSIIYYIIPVIVIVFSIFLTGGLAASKLGNLDSMANMTSTEVSNAILTPDFIAAVIIILVIAVVLYILFTLLALMGQARLANTGSIDEAISFRQSYRDLKEIGVLKTLGFLILLTLLVFVIGFALIGICLIPIFGLLIVSLIGIPFILILQYRAYGLLYSEIA